MAKTKPRPEEATMTPAELLSYGAEVYDPKGFYVSVDIPGYPGEIIVNRFYSPTREEFLEAIAEVAFDAGVAHAKETMRKALGASGGKV